MNFKCFFFGHKISSITDSGFMTCDRCKAHEYYDNNFCLTIPTIFKFYYYKIKSSIYWKTIFYERCSDCGKIGQILNKKIGNHSNCLPF